MASAHEEMFERWLEQSGLEGLDEAALESVKNAFLSGAQAGARAAHAHHAANPGVVEFERNKLIRRLAALLRFHEIRWRTISRDVHEPEASTAVGIADAIGQIRNDFVALRGGPTRPDLPAAKKPDA